MADPNTCEICGNIIHPYAFYCKRCKKLIDRGDTHKKVNKKARVQALKRAWDGEGFRCYYSGIKLIEDNSKDPRYLTFDHRIPRKESDIVAAASLLNDMKSDMSDDEFKAIITELSIRLDGGSFNENVFNLKYWKR